MIKKIGKVLLGIILVILVFLLQIYVFNKFTLFGIKGNLILVMVLVVSTGANIYLASCFGTVTGICCDILFTNSIGRYVVIYLIIAIGVNSLLNIYKRESKGAIILLTIGGTIIYEIFMFISYFALYTEFVNVFSYVYMLIKEILLNIALAYIVHVVMDKLFEINKKQREIYTRF